MKVNHIYKIGEYPFIYLSIGTLYWNELPIHEQKSYLLCHPMWYFSWTSLPLYFKKKRELKKKNIELILLSNSKKENIFARIFGFKSYFINQNIHACEANFNILPNKKKIYDAVYIAAAKPYKRLHLAKRVKSLYIITYFWPDIRDENGDWDLHSFEPAIKHAAFNKRRIDNEQITLILNQSKCGLALSKKEGAMWAIMEYLYSGLPIVTTKSIGGRDFFYDNRFVTIVKDSARAVDEAVQYYSSNKIDPKFIRDTTISKVKKARKTFFNLICEINNTPYPVGQSFEDFHEKIWGGKGIYKHQYFPRKK